MSSTLDSAGSDPSTALKERGYAVMQAVVDVADLQRFAAYALMNCQHPGYYLQEPGSGAQSRYADGLGESLLHNLRPRLETALNLALLPSHSLLRLYARGASVEAHREPREHELCALLAVAAAPDDVWPLWFEASGKNMSVDLKSGDLLVFNGGEFAFWREELSAENWLQLHLYFVREKGEFAHHRFDGRRGLGQPLNREEQDAVITQRMAFDKALAAGDDQPCFCGSAQAYSQCHGLMRQTLTA